MAAMITDAAELASPRVKVLSSGIVGIGPATFAESGLISRGIQSKKGTKEQGAPLLAEKIPFEPDLGNASVGNGE